MPHRNRFLTLATLCAVSLVAPFAHAAPMLDLGRYALSSSHAIDQLGGMGLEASAVTYAADRNSLFIVGDEGLGVVEIGLTGRTIGSMAFDWSGTGSSNNDAEGLTYLGNGELVVVDERPQVAYRFSYSAGGSIQLNNQPKVAITGSTSSVGNVGTEGISVDARNGSFYSVKQDNPAQLRVSTLNFAVGGGTASTTVLHAGANSLFGLNNLSDVQALSSVSWLAGSPAADHVLVLSLDSRRLVELAPESGTVISSLDLSGLTLQAIEGVTVDTLGTIYLVAEDSGTPSSRLFVLSAPVPEPGAYAMLLLGLAGLGVVARRRAER